MKKIFLSVITIFICSLATNAQKGSTLVTFGFGLTASDNGPGTKTTTTNVGTSVGYQFNNNWTVGMGLGYSNANSSYSVEEYSVGPFIRYTKEISSIFSIYGQFSTSYFHLLQNPGDIKTNGFDIGFFPALFINVKNGFGLNLNFGGISYNWSKFSGGGYPTPTYKIFNVNFGQGANFSISKNFGGKHKV